MYKYSSVLFLFLIGIGTSTCQNSEGNYKPAFSGQTRIESVLSTTRFRSTVLTDELKSPWAIACLPDGRLIITEKKGTLRIATTQGKLSESITGLPDVATAGQGGLLGIAVDPAFQTNRLIYWAFSEKTEGGNHTSVAKGRLAEDEKAVQNVSVIYRAGPAVNSSLHFGGRLKFDHDSNLILSTGERYKESMKSQETNNGLGKIIRITTEGKAIASNPFFNKPNVNAEIISYGHRNVQGIAFNPATGDLWACEFGPRGGDEINRIQPGKNYGWPIISYGIDYGGSKINDGIQQKEGMEQPVYYYDPSVSPSGMTFYSGSVISEWKNNLFVACLSGSQIARLVIKNNKITGEEKLLTKENQRFRDIIEGNDGRLYSITDQGKLYQIGL